MHPSSRETLLSNEREELFSSACDGNGKEQHSCMKSYDESSVPPFAALCFNINQTKAKYDTIPKKYCIVSSSNFRWKPFLFV